MVCPTVLDCAAPRLRSPIQCCEVLTSAAGYSCTIKDSDTANRAGATPLRVSDVFLLLLLLLLLLLPSIHTHRAPRPRTGQAHDASRTLSANTCQDLSSPPLSSSSSSGRVAKCSGNVANALAREALGQVGRHVHTHRDRERGLYTHIIDCTYTYIHIDYRWMMLFIGT